MIQNDELNQILLRLENKELIKDILKDLNISTPIQNVISELKTKFGSQKILDLILQSRKFNFKNQNENLSFNQLKNIVKNLNNLSSDKIDIIISNLQDFISELTIKKQRLNKEELNLDSLITSIKSKNYTDIDEMNLVLQKLRECISYITSLKNKISIDKNQKSCKQCNKRKSEEKLKLNTSIESILKGD